MTSQRTDEMIDSMRMIIEFKNDRITELEHELKRLQAAVETKEADVRALYTELERLRAKI